MNPTPTISEAARRAAKTIEEEYVRSPRDGAAKRDIASIIQSALDSAHPAPKEGETPETDAVWQKLPHEDRLGTVRGLRDFARSLELRLSEAKREVEAYRKAGEGKATCGEMSCEECDREKDSLRSHLKTANELLVQARDKLPNYEGYAGLFHRIRAHFTQQSK